MNRESHLLTTSGLVFENFRSVPMHVHIFMSKMYFNAVFQFVYDTVGHNKLIFVIQSEASSMSPSSSPVSDSKTLREPLMLSLCSVDTLLTLTVPEQTQVAK